MPNEPNLSMFFSSPHFARNRLTGDQLAADLEFSRLAKSANDAENEKCPSE